MMDCVRKTIQWEGPTGLYKVLLLLLLLHSMAEHGHLNMATCMAHMAAWSACMCC